MYPFNNSIMNELMLTLQIKRERAYVPIRYLYLWKELPGTVTKRQTGMADFSSRD